MELRDLQCLLGALYGIDIDTDVRDFLVTDRRSLAPWQPAMGERDIDEELLIEEGAEAIGIALYLDAGIIERLARLDLRELLCGRNFDDYCTAVEGISHFNTVAWSAARDRKVTLLELEMQAEVDKYVSARWLLAQQADGATAPLVRRLFSGAIPDPVLAPAVQRRYEDAWMLAARYCLSLEARFPRRAPTAVMLEELRRFFRWPQPAKVSHIHAAAFAS